VLGAVLSTALPAPGPRAGYLPARVPLRDGGALSAWHRTGDRGPLVLLLHGLGGSTRAGYLRVAADAAARRGCGVLAVNQRGSGGRDERTCLPYMAGNVDDLADILLWIRTRHPARPVLVVGFSLSGNTLLKWLGSGARHLPEMALAVNPPIDLDHTSRGLLAWPQHAYDLWILRSCRRWTGRLRGPGVNGPAPRYRVPALSSLREFDRRYIAPVWGFESRESYYASASSAGDLTGIEVPTAILAAADDPIVDLERLTAAPRSPSVALHVQPHGGHLGYLTAGASGRGLRRWLTDALDHYLDHVPTAKSPSPCAP
jgi:uncharacterized protein